MGQPRLKRLDLWEKHERLVIEVLTTALRLLSQDKGLPATEDPINRKLYFCILRAIRQLHEQDQHLTSVPFYEGSNQPDASDQERAAREGKRPDFQFAFIDHQEPDPAASAKQYVIECKRLGESGRSDWVLNVNYVEHGIVRFRDEEYGCGKSRPSGAMIGYLQNSSPDRILDDVNRTVTARQMSRLQLSREGWQPRDVSALFHRFDRPVPPTPFDLHHLWLDLIAQNRH